VKLQTKRVIVLVVGWIFIVLGIAGLFLPILQGVLFLLIGLAILSTEYVWAHHLLRRLGERFPRLHARIEHARERARGWVHHDRGPRPGASGPGAP
jgi:uncharacterized membrane protein YbaN (DUF454 family)